jgi:hypothetical protein
VGAGKNRKVVASQQSLPAKYFGPCSLSFKIAAVPLVPFYQVTIGRHPPLTYSRAEMDAQNWQLSLKLQGSLSSGG